MLELTAEERRQDARGTGGGTGGPNDPDIAFPGLQRIVFAVEQMVGHGVDPDTFETLHAIRDIGNIGAHPERDIGLIVEVEPGEADLLLKSVETLIEDTWKYLD